MTDPKPQDWMIRLLENAGVNSDKIVADPGLVFSVVGPKVRVEYTGWFDVTSDDIARAVLV